MRWPPDDPFPDFQMDPILQEWLDQAREQEKGEDADRWIAENRRMLESWLRWEEACFD